VNRRLVFLMLGLIGGLGLLVVNHDGGKTLGLANEDFAHMLSMGLVASLIGSGIVASRHNLAGAITSLGIWAVIILSVATAYLYRADMLSMAGRVAGGLMPGYASVETAADGRQSVVLTKGMNGHFATTASIDGKPVSMMVDTGASMVALSYEDARIIGLEPETLQYSLMVSTANGMARSAPVRLSTLSIGPIIRKDVRATVAQKGRLEQSLLGMSFLSSLSVFEMTQDQLRLKD
jgi:aspartyl protease family protein